MTTVNLSNYHEDNDKYVTITVDMDEISGNEVYEVSINEGWYSEKGLNMLIKELQKAKRIYKTRTIKEGD